MAHALTVMVKLVSVLGLLAVAFGPSYSYTALRLVYSTRWSETEAPTVLACYCLYILLLAVNGECYCLCALLLLPVDFGSHGLAGFR